MKILAIALMTLLLQLGCSELPENGKPLSTAADRVADFNALVEKWRGKMDYAGTVERAGIPTRKEVLSDGGLIAEWTVQGGGVMIAPGLRTPGMQLPAIAVPVQHGSTARLRFDAAGLLVSGTYIEW